MKQIIIHSFWDLDTKAEVLEKLEEYTSLKRKAWQKPTCYWTKDTSNIMIDDNETIVHCSNDKCDWYESISADDYLNPIRRWDKVEVIMKWDHCIKVWTHMYVSRVEDVIAYCNICKTTDDWYIEWLDNLMHVDYLQVLKKQFNTWDIIRYKDHTVEYKVMRVYPKWASKEYMIKSCNSWETYPVKFWANLELVRDALTDSVEQTIWISPIVDFANKIEEEETIPWMHFNVWDEVEYTNRTEFQYKSWKVTNILDWWLTLEAIHQLDITVEIKQYWSDLNKLRLVKPKLDWLKFTHAIIDEAATYMNAITNEALDNMTDTILNINNKNMSTIKQSETAIANEAFFADTKEVKKFTEANESIIELKDLLSVALQDIEAKECKVIHIYNMLNKAFNDKDSKYIKEILWDLPEIKEFIKTYIKSTVKQLGTTKVEEEKFNVEEYFKD